MTHYVCTGDCGNESSKPGVCLAEGCTKEDQPLVECNCDDGIHKEVTTVRGDDFQDVELDSDE